LVFLGTVPRGRDTRLVGDILLRYAASACVSRFTVLSRGGAGDEFDFRAVFVRIGTL
jgi:hypothetical protein